MPKKAVTLTKKIVEQYCNTLPVSRSGHRLNYKCYADGRAPGLYIKVHANVLGIGTWFYRQQATSNAPRFEQKIGYFPAMSIAEARKEAFKLRGQYLNDPESFCPKTKPSLSLRDAADAWFKHAEETKYYKRKQYYLNEQRRTEQYVLKYIGQTPINELNRQVLVQTLEPIWDHPRIVKFLLTTLRHIFRFAIHLGYLDVPDLNTLNLKVMEIDLGKLTTDVQHYGALHVDEIPEFMHVLRSSDDIRSFAFEFEILCALRPSNVRNLKWLQVHLGNPSYLLFSKKDMKVSKNGNFKVPLSSRCIEILQIMRRYQRKDLPKDQQFVFPSPYDDYSKPWSLTRWFTFWETLHNEKKKVNGVGWIDRLATEILIADSPNSNVKAVKITPHGTARTSFRMWAGSQTNFRYKPIEYCLHHKVGSDVENAYDRSDYFEERLQILEEWAKYCCSFDENNFENECIKS